MTGKGSRRFRRRRDILLILWSLMFAYYYSSSGSASGSVLVGRRARSGPSPASGESKRISSSSSEESGEMHWEGGWVEENSKEEKELALEEEGSLGAGGGTGDPGSPPGDGDGVKYYRSRNGRINYAKWEVPGVNCTPPGIDDFPPDLFTQEERRQGYVVIHFLVSLYIFVGLAVVCDDYFVPSMERISEGKEDISCSAMDRME
jgi:hypothetical protein